MISGPFMIIDFELPRARRDGIYEVQYYTVPPASLML